MIDCIHELPLDQCSLCKKKVYVGPFWDARYEQMCGHPQCHSVISVGDRVRWNDEGTKAIHAKHK